MERVNELSWKETKLGEEITLKRGYDLPLNQRVPGPYPIVTSSGIAGFHEEFKAKGPGVVTGRTGTLGKVFYIQDDFWPHNTALYVQDFKGNSTRFIFYLLQTLGFELRNAAAAVPTVDRNYLHLLEVSMPSLYIQERIGGVLSTYDQLIDINRRRIRILEKTATAVYREWFVHFNFPGREKVEMVDSEIGDIPHSWKITKATDAIEFSPRLKIPKTGTRWFVPMKGLSKTSMVIGYKERRNGSAGSKFQNRDTLFPRITPSLEHGKNAYVQFLEDGEVGIGSTEFIVLRSRTLCPEYVYLLSRTFEFRENAVKSMIGASGRQRVQMQCFDGFYFAHPDSETLTQFESLVSPMFRFIHSLFLKNEALFKMRELLLPRLVSGQLDISTVILPDFALQRPIYKEQSRLDRWLDDGDEEDAERD